MESCKLDAIAVAEALKGNLVILHEGDHIVIVEHDEFAVIRADGAVDTKYYSTEETAILREGRILKVYANETGDYGWTKYV